MSKDKKPVARKLKFDKKHVRKLGEQELGKAGGGAKPSLVEGDCEDGGSGGAVCNCNSGFRCCANHNQALRAR